MIVSHYLCPRSYGPSSNRCRCRASRCCCRDNEQGSSAAGLVIRWVDANGNPMRNVQGYVAWLRYANPNGRNPNVAYSFFDNNGVTTLDVDVPTTELYQLEIYVGFNPNLVQSVYILRGTTEYILRSENRRY